MGFCISPQSPPRKLPILTAISKLCPPFTAVCEKTSAVTPDFFSLVFAKNSLIKNIFQEETKFDSRTIFFFENSSVVGVFESRRQLHANHGTVRKSAISPQPGNQKLIKWSNTAYLNKRSVKILSVSSNKDFCMKATSKNTPVWEPSDA